MKLTVPGENPPPTEFVMMARSVTAVPRATDVMGAVVPSVSTLNAAVVDVPCAKADAPARIIAAAAANAARNQGERAEAADRFTDSFQRDSNVGSSIPLHNSGLDQETGPPHTNARTSLNRRFHVVNLANSTLGSTPECLLAALVHPGAQNPYGNGSILRF
jgi:hypothetical protein